MEIPADLLLVFLWLLLVVVALCLEHTLLERTLFDVVWWLWLWWLLVAKELALSLTVWCHRWHPVIARSACETCSDLG